MSAIYINGEPVVQSNFPEMTLAQYNALPEAEKPEFWIRTDASYDSIPGTAVTFDNEGTTIESTDVDGAIKEVDANRKEDLTSISESGTTASQAISARTYFYLDGTLVRAKVNIASGATFTENTNYEVVNGALNAVVGETDFILQNYSIDQCFTYLMNNIPTEKVVTGIIKNTSSGEMIYIGFVYEARSYGSALFLTVASSQAMVRGQRRAGTDTVTII